MAITKARDPKVWEKTKHFPISRNWKKLKPIFESEQARKIWYPCMDEYQMGRCHEFKYTYKPRPEAKCPSDWDGGDWVCSKIGRTADYWRFACMGACHWIADLALFGAMEAFPKTAWRIITSRKHSTVWNGCVDNPVIFDINFSAIGLPAHDAIEMASRGSEMKPGRYIKKYLHYA